MEVISKISIFSSTLNNTKSIILFYHENPSDSDVYSNIDLSKRIYKTTDGEEGYYELNKKYFETNTIIFLDSFNSALGYIVLAKNIINSLSRTNTTHNVKTAFKPTLVKLYIKYSDEFTLIEDASIYHSLISTNSDRFDGVLCTAPNILNEVPINRYGTVMSPNVMVLNGWCRYKDGQLWKLQTNKDITSSFDFTDWSINFMFYKGDPSIYMWKDNKYSIQSLTRKTPLNTTYPYTLPLGYETTVQHKFEKGNVDWVYGDFIKSDDKIYFWDSEEEYDNADEYIIDHFSMSNKLYKISSLMTRLTDLVKPYKELKKLKLTDVYGDWFVFDGRIFVNSKYYKEFTEEDKILPLNNRALLNITDKKIYCSNGEVLDSLDTFRRNSKYIKNFNGSEIILYDPTTKEEVQGNIIGSIGSLIYYYYGKNNINYL